jgi:hypothetical protein
VLGVATVQLPSQRTVPPQLPQLCPKLLGVAMVQLPSQRTVPPQLPQLCPRLAGVATLQLPLHCTFPPQPPQLPPKPGGAGWRQSQVPACGAWLVQAVPSALQIWGVVSEQRTLAGTQIAPQLGGVIAKLDHSPDAEHVRAAVPLHSLVPGSHSAPHTPFFTGWSLHAVPSLLQVRGCVPAQPCSEATQTTPHSPTVNAGSDQSPVASQR